VLVTNAFVWYAFVIELLTAIVQTAHINQSTVLLIWALHFGGIAVSALVGAFLAKRIKDRSRFILYWMFLGVILSAISIVINLTLIPNILALSLLFGVSLGFGMPSCMGYFADSIAVEKRGRVGGIIFLLTGLTIVTLEIVAGAGIGYKVVILAGWRLFGLLMFLLFLKYWPMNEVLSKNKPVPYKPLLNYKPFLLYLVPWLMFSLLTNLTTPMLTNMTQSMQNSGVNIPSIEYLRSIENLLGAVFGVIGGFLIDFVGRKRMSIIGFAMLGLGYSFLGILSENPLTWYFYTFVDGAAWGIFFVIFVITIWADLSNGSSSEKYYAVGVLPFFFSYFLRFTVGFDLSVAIPKEAIFSFVAFFLFLAVLPLVYAPETLPEKVMKDRDLKSYAEKALQKAQKKEKKDHKKEDNKAKEDAGGNEGEAEEKGEEYEEARKLAEKYY
jgi:MFS family permease